MGYNFLGDIFKPLKLKTIDIYENSWLKLQCQMLPPNVQCGLQFGKCHELWFVLPLNRELIYEHFHKKNPPI